MRDEHESGRARPGHGKDSGERRKAREGGRARKGEREVEDGSENVGVDVRERACTGIRPGRARQTTDAVRVAAGSPPAERRRAEQQQPWRGWNGQAGTRMLGRREQEARATAFLGTRRGWGEREVWDGETEKRERDGGGMHDARVLDFRYTESVIAFASPQGRARASRSPGQLVGRCVPRARARARPSIVLQRRHTTTVCSLPSSRPAAASSEG